MEAPENIPESGAIFTFGSSKLTGNTASCFWLKNDVIISASCGDEHTALVTEKGKVYVFGSNNWGQLGLGHTHPSKKPTCIKSLKLYKATMVACGRTHTLVCTSDNKLFAFGNNSDFQLGIDSLSNSEIPTEVNFKNIGKIKQVAAGADFSVVLTEDGDVYIWGSNAEGQLGLGNDVNEAESPTMIKGIEQIELVACGYYHTALLSRTGNLYTFGEDEFGKLGQRENEDTSVPSRLKIPDSVKVSKVACGGSHTAFTSQSGELYTLGGGSHGELGHGSNTLQILGAKLVERLKGHNVCHVSCGENFSSIVTKKGRLYTFGDGRHGKLALDEENFVNQFKPFRCKRFNEFDVKFAICGGCHMIVSACARQGDANETDSEIEDPLLTYIESSPDKGDSQLIKEMANGHPNGLSLSSKGTTDLSRSLSAREKRRKGRESTLSRTLPPLRTMKATELAEMARTLPKPVALHESISNDWPNPPEKSPVKDRDDISEISAFNKVHKLVKVGNIDALIPVKKADKVEEEEEDDDEEDETEEEEDEDEEEVDEEEEEDEEVESVKDATLVEDISKDDAAIKPGTSGKVETGDAKSLENEKPTKEEPKKDAVEKLKDEKQDEDKQDNEKTKDKKEKKPKEGQDSKAPKAEEDKKDDPSTSGEKQNKSKSTPETQDDKPKESGDAAKTPETNPQQTNTKKATKKSKFCVIL